jgi:hypothetical protein
VTRSFTTSSWPAREAMWRAVLPFLVAASITAPRFRSSFTISTWPSLEAKCRAFRPFWKAGKTKRCKNGPAAISILRLQMMFPF